MNDLERRGPGRPQNLRELAFARGLAVLMTEPGLEQPKRRGEAVGQLPTWQRRCLVERAGLLLRQGEIVQRFEDEVVRLVGSSGDGARRSWVDGRVATVLAFER